MGVTADGVLGTPAQQGLAQYLKHKAPYDTDASNPHKKPRNPGNWPAGGNGHGPKGAQLMAAHSQSWENSKFSVYGHDATFPSLAARLMFAADDEGKPTQKNKIKFTLWNYDIWKLIGLVKDGEHETL